MTSHLYCDPASRVLSLVIPALVIIMLRLTLILCLCLTLTSETSGMYHQGQNYKQPSVVISPHEEPAQFFKSMTGSYLFAYDTGNMQQQSFRKEGRDVDGTVTGYYGYIDPEGVMRITEYVADRRGYRQWTTLRYPVDYL